MTQSPASRLWRYVEDRPHIRQLITFGVIGVVATVTHATCALLAEKHLHLVPIVANLVGYLCAFSISYFGNARFTFRRRILHGPQFFRFVAASIAGLILSECLTYLFVNLVGLPFRIALIPVVIVVPIFSFVLSKLYAFADHKPQVAAPADHSSV